MKLRDKVAIITGGAMGNGLGVVEVFLKYGAKVVIFDYAQELDETVKRINNPNLIGYQVDIRDNAKVQECVDAVFNKYGIIDILINNAGVCKLETFDKTSNELRDFHFDINIKGTWNVTSAVVPYMKKNSTGSIVNLSSVTGVLVADSGEVAYATTKAAVLGFTKGLAAELAKDNIRVNAILPGYIMTPMVENMALQTNPSNPSSVVDGIASAIPMKRLGTITELGELAAFLASAEASYITAQGIVIDGGSTLSETMTMGV